MKFRSTRYTRGWQAIAMLVCFAIIFVAFFSTLYIIHEAHHDCTGADCPICACVHRCEENLRQLGTGLAKQPVAVVILVQTAIIVLLFSISISNQTLVGQKVRMDN